MFVFILYRLLIIEIIILQNYFLKSDYVIRAKNECIFGQNPSRQSGALIPQRQKSYITHLRVLPDLQLQLLEISIGECLIEWLG
jgi:hypothetical protein